MQGHIIGQERKSWNEHNWIMDMLHAWQCRDAYRCVMNTKFTLKSAFTFQLFSNVESLERHFINIGALKINTSYCFSIQYTNLFMNHQILTYSIFKKAFLFYIPNIPV